MELAQAVLSVMLYLSPESTWRAHPGFEETVDERRARYAEIARDIVATVDAEGPAPGRSREWTVTLLVGTSFHESGYALDVDRSTCWQPKVGVRRCDGGRAHGLWQVHADRRFSAAALKDRRTNARAALRKLKASLAMCATSEPRHRLAAYGSGRCNVGLAGSRSLVGMHARAQQLFAIATAPSAS